MSLTHIDEHGQAHMVDVGDKADTQREAVAKGCITMHPNTLALIQNNEVAKGNVLTVAQVAGIMAAKKTADLIPMCHSLNLNKVGLEFSLKTTAISAQVDIKATVCTTGKTGVEMEALTAVSVAGLTIYDMCKAVDKTMSLDAIRLVKKTGGKSGDIVLE